MYPVIWIWYLHVRLEYFCCIGSIPKIGYQFAGDPTSTLPCSWGKISSFAQLNSIQGIRGCFGLSPSYTEVTFCHCICTHVSSNCITWGGCMWSKDVGVMIQLWMNASCTVYCCAQYCNLGIMQIKHLVQQLTFSFMDPCTSVGLLSDSEKAWGWGYHSSLLMQWCW